MYMKKIVLTSLLVSVILLAGCSHKAVQNLPQDSGGITSQATLSSQTPVQEETTGALPSSELLSQETENSGEIYEIKEKLFITQCNDVYLNPDDYMNRTIKLEGIYDEYTDTETKEVYRYVIRYGPGCCGNDGVAGFEIIYEGEPPRLKDWIEVVGTIEMVERDQSQYVVLRLSELTIMDERGAEFVSY